MKTELKRNTVCVKVLFDDGDYFTTRINLTFEEAKQYYIGKQWNVGFGESDLYKKCTSVELIETIQ